MSLNSLAQSSPGKMRRLALWLTFITGFTGLVYEVAWHKYLANLLGSQAQATSIILAVFLGGLSVGYGIFGRASLSRPPRILLRLYGIMEIMIGLWALLFPTLYQAIWRNLGVIDTVLQPGAFSNVLICIFLIAVPTVLMGATLPLLTQSLARDIRDSRAFHGKVYAINALGAFLGALVGGLLLIPRLGLGGTLAWMAPLNLAAGVIFLGCAFVLSSQKLSEVTFPESSGLERAREWSDLSLPRAALLAALAGFYAISLQTLLIRVVGLSAGSSEYAFAVIVGVFILMIALGAWVLAARTKTSLPLWINQSAVLAGCLILYFLIPNWPWLAHIARILYTSIELNFYYYHLTIFLGLALMLLLPIGAMGATMPLLFGAVRTRHQRIGLDIGVLYAVNTVGCVAGALVGGYFMLFSLNLDQVFKICLVLAASTIFVSLPRRQWNRRRVAALSFATVVVLITPWLPVWNTNFIGLGLFRIREATPYSMSGPRNFWRNHFAHLVMLDYKDGPNVSIGVVQSTASPSSNRYALHPSRILLANGKSEGNTVGNDLRTTRLLAHIPALLQTSESKKALVIGFGTGITVGSLTLYEEIEEIQCVEISPVVRDMAPYFEFANHQAGSHPKVNWLVGDAYRVLGTSPDLYSIIISEPSNPWIAGVEKLFTVEFYEEAYQRLALGGIYVQWMQLYSSSPETLGLVVQTFSSVFPSVRLFHNDLDLILVGTAAPLDEKSLRMLSERYTNEAVAKDLSEIGITAQKELLKAELQISVGQFPKPGVQTLDSPRLSYMAGKDFFLGGRVELDKLQDQERDRFLAKQAASNALINRWLQIQGQEGL